MQSIKIVGVINEFKILYIQREEIFAGKDFTLIVRQKNQFFIIHRDQPVLSLLDYISESSRYKEQSIEHFFRIALSKLSISERGPQEYTPGRSD